MTERWFVVSYRGGWYAGNHHGDGAYFPKWDEAIRFAQRQARENFERYSKRGLLKLAGAFDVPAAGLPHTSHRPITDVELDAARAMRTNGRTWIAIGEVLDRSPGSIQAAVWRAEHAAANALDEEAI